MDKMIIINIVNIFLIVLLLLLLIAVFVLIRANRNLESVIEFHKKKVRERDKRSVNQKNEDEEMLNRMVPKELFEVLQVKNTTELSFENQKYAEMANMYVNSNDFSSIMHAMDAKELFIFINRFFDKVIPLIYKEDGVVDEFHEAGMSVLFLKKPERAIAVAISFCDVLNVLGKLQPEYNDFSIGLCYENAIVGVVGHPKRLSMLTLSAEASGFSKWLQSIAEKYYAKIVVDDTYADQIPDFTKKFNVRFLGYVYVQDTDSMRKVYDVFDGDEKDTRNRKRQTKMLFEKGVLLFTEQNYQEARQHFIEVLKTDRMDKAAKEYVYLCEWYLKESEEKKNVYIECYG